MISKTALLKTAARAAYFVLSRAVFAGVFGGVCNLVFAALLWPEIKTLAFRFVPNLPHGGGAVALVILAVMALPALSLAALFLLGFPVAYFLLGKKYGIGVAISKELAARKDVLLAYFFDRLFAAISARTDWLDQFKRGGIAAIVREVLPQFLAPHLWHNWPVVEAQTLPPPNAPSAPPSPVPARTQRRWRARLLLPALLLLQVLATSGSPELELLAQQVGLGATRAELVRAYQQASRPPPSRCLSSLAALLHRLCPCVRLM
jgi:hypothetical protein